MKNEIQKLQVLKLGYNEIKIDEENLCVVETCFDMNDDDFLDDVSEMIKLLQELKKVYKSKLNKKG